MKKILKEFKDFISRGNVLDLAIGMIIGAAFTAIVSSLVGDIFTPIIGFLVPEGGFAALNGIGPGFNFGNFINALITFFITALCLFMVVKAVNGLKSIGKKKKEEEPAAPTTKICPYCKSEIHIDATKCPHCTSDVE
ncbi:MAG: large conductance mechanosensitive channel protein MscL [Butyrivibrio sp.]